MLGFGFDSLSAVMDMLYAPNSDLGHSIPLNLSYQFEPQCIRSSDHGASFNHFESSSFFSIISV